MTPRPRHDARTFPARAASARLARATRLVTFALGVSAALLMLAGPVLAQTRPPARPGAAAPRTPSARKPAPAPTTATARPAPGERAAALAAANAALSAGRTADGARLLRAAAERFQSAQAWLQLARVQSEQGDATGALASLQQARTLAPNSEDVLSAGAQLQLAMRAWVPAVATLESLTRIYPSSAQYHYLLGIAFLQAGDASSSADALSRAERLEPADLRVLVALGLALNQQKRYADAKTILLRGVEQDPDSADALAALAESEDGLGELAAAEVHVQRALSKARTHATANLVKGMVLMKQARYAEARDAFQIAALEDPDAAKIDYQLSLAYARLGDSALSQQHLDRYQQKRRDAETRLAAWRRGGSANDSGAGRTGRP